MNYQQEAKPDLFPDDFIDGGPKGKSVIDIKSLNNDFTIPDPPEDLLKLKSLYDRTYIKNKEVKVQPGLDRGLVINGDSMLYEFADAKFDPSGEAGVDVYAVPFGYTARLDAEFVILEELIDVDHPEIWLKISFNDDLSSVFFIKKFDTDYFSKIQTVESWGYFDNVRGATDAIKLGEEISKLGWPYFNDKKELNNIRKILEPYNYHSHPFKVMHYYFMKEFRKKFNGLSLIALLIKKVGFAENIEIFRDLSVFDLYAPKTLIAKEDGFQRYFEQQEKDGIKYVLIGTNKKPEDYENLRDKIKTHEKFSKSPGWKEFNERINKKDPLFDVLKINPYEGFASAEQKYRDKRIKEVKKQGYQTSLINETVQEIMVSGWKAIAQSEMERQIQGELNFEGYGRPETTKRYDQAEKKIKARMLRRAQQLLSPSQKKVYKLIMRLEELKKKYGDMEVLPNHIDKEGHAILDEMKALGKLPNLYDHEGQLKEPPNAPKDYGERIQNNALAEELQKTYKDQLGDLFYSNYFQYDFIYNHWNSAKKDRIAENNKYLYKTTRRVVSTQQKDYYYEPVEKAIETEKHWESIYWNKKAELVTVMRAYLLNEDMAHLNRDGFWGGFNEAFWESLGYQVETNNDFINGYVRSLSDAGMVLTDKQKERLKRTLWEDTGAAVGGTISVTIELIVTTLITRGLGTLPVAAKFGRQTLRLFINVLGGNKGKKAYRLWLAGIVGAVSYSMGGQSAAGGAAETMAGTLFDVTIAKKYPWLAQFVLRTMAETAGEYAGEKIGQLTEQFVSNHSLTESIEAAFGKNLDEAQHKFAVDMLSTLMMSKGTAAGTWTYSQARKQINHYFPDKDDVFAKEELLRELRDHQKRYGGEMDEIESLNRSKEEKKKKQSKEKKESDTSGLPSMANVDVSKILDPDKDWVAMMNKKGITVNLAKYHSSMGNKPIVEEFAHLWIELLHSSKQYGGDIDKAIETVQASNEFSDWLTASPEYLRKALNVSTKPEKQREYLAKEFLGQLVTTNGKIGQSNSTLNGIAQKLRDFIVFLFDGIGIDLRNGKETINELIAQTHKDITGEKMLTEANSEMIENFLAGTINQLNILRLFNNEKKVTLIRNNTPSTQTFYNLNDKIVKSSKGHNSKGFFLDKSQYPKSMVMEEMMSINHTYNTKNEKWVTLYNNLMNCPGVTLAGEQYFQSKRNKKTNINQAADTGGKTTKFITKESGQKANEQYFSKFMSAAEITNAMMKLPEGASGIVAAKMFSANDPHGDGQGHVFNVVKLDGKVWFVDFQIGEIYDPLVLDFRVKPSKVSLFGGNKQKGMRLYIPDQTLREKADLETGIRTHRIYDNWSQTNTEARNLANETFLKELDQSLIQDIQSNITDPLFKGDLAYENRDKSVEEFERIYAESKTSQLNNFNVEYGGELVADAEGKKEFWNQTKADFNEVIVRLARLPESDRNTLLPLLQSLIHRLQITRNTRSLMQTKNIAFQLLNVVKSMDSAEFLRYIKAIDYLQRNEPVQNRGARIQRKLHEALEQLNSDYVTMDGYYLVNDVETLATILMHEKGITEKLEIPKQDIPKNFPLKVLEPSGKLNKVVRNSNIVKKVAPGLTFLIGHDLEAPKLEDAQFSYVGEVAYPKGTKENVDLDFAMKLNQVGTDMDQIRKETNWFLAADGKWRYEVDDSNSVLTNSGELSNLIKEYYDSPLDGIQMKLSDIMDAPEIFKLYPEIGNKIVTINNTGDKIEGEFNRSTESFSFNIGYFIHNLEKESAQDLEEEMKALLKHEIQHYIQKVEGFNSGTSIGSQIIKLNEHVQFSKLFYSFDMSEKQRVRLREKEIEIAKKMYFLKLGEIEARSSQDRSDMSAEERKKSDPQSLGKPVEMTKEEVLKLWTEAADEIRGSQFQLKNGKFKGAFTRNGEVVVNLSEATEDTPIHELSHFWIDLLHKMDPNILLQLKSKIEKDKSIFGKDGAFLEEWNRIQNDPHYSQLSEIGQAKELFAQLIGMQGAKIADRGVLMKMLHAFWDALSSIFKSKGLESVAKRMKNGTISLGEFTKVLAEELASGEQKTNMTSEMFVELMKNGKADGIEFYGSVLGELYKGMLDDKPKESVMNPYKTK